MRKFTTAAAVVALMTAAPAMAQQNQQQGQSGQQQQAQQKQGQGQQQGQMSQQDAKFAKEAATGNMLEVRLGDLAQQQAERDEVKQFGERMAQDHGDAQDKLKEILQQANAEVPQELPQDKQQQVDRLKEMQGQEFDRAYMQLMVRDHEKDVQAYQQYSQNGQHDELKSYAEETLSTLEEHHQRAREIAQQIGVQVQASGQQQQGQQQAMAGDPGTEVIVDQGAADVQVQQPSPDVRVVDPEPQVRVQTPEPEVSVDMPKPEVEVQQAQPDVQIEEQGQADVTIVERQTTQSTQLQQDQQRQQQAQRETEQDGEVEQALEEAGQETEQAARQTGQALTPQEEGERTALDVQEDEVELQQRQTAQEGGQMTTTQQQSQQTAALDPQQGANLQDLVGSAVYGENDEQVGEISDVLMSPEGQAEGIVIDRGGFLGIGEKTIALDMEDIEITQDRVRVKMTDQQIGELPEWTGPGN